MLYTQKQANKQTNRITSDFSLEIMKAKKQWNNIFKAYKEKKNLSTQN